MARSEALPSRCVVCQESFQDHDEVQRIPAPEMVARGVKSNVLGIYEHHAYKDDGEDVIHFPHCCVQYFDPEDNPRLYDELCARLQEDLEPQIREEIAEEFKERFERVLGAAAMQQTLPRICQSCWNEDEPIMCIFCKQKECVWERRTRENIFYFCSGCGKQWNEYEEEVAA